MVQSHNTNHKCFTWKQQHKVHLVRQKENDCNKKNKCVMNAFHLKVNVEMPSEREGKKLVIGLNVYFMKCAAFINTFAHFNKIVGRKCISGRHLENSQLYSTRTVRYSKHLLWVQMLSVLRSRKVLTHYFTHTHKKKGECWIDYGCCCG